MHTAYTVGPSVRVSEDIRYTDGTPTFDVHYGIQNISGDASRARGRARRPLRRQQRQRQRRISHIAPRFVGGRDEASGLVYGLQEVTPWRSFQEGGYEFVFDNFSAAGLNNTVDSAAPDNGVGVDSRSTSRRGRRRASTCAGCSPPPAPPGTVVAAPAGGAAHRGREAQPAPAAGRGQDRQRRRPQGPDLREDPAEQEVHRAQGPAADPGRVDDRRPQGPREPGLRRRPAGHAAARLVLRRRLHDRPDRRREADHLAQARRGARALPEERARRRGAAAKKKTRKLWGEGKGNFRTDGKFSSATVRGTRWLVTDRCDGTLTRVTEGSVTRARLQKRKNVIVRAGKQYLARAK